MFAEGERTIGEGLPVLGRRVVAYNLGSLGISRSSGIASVRTMLVPPQYYTLSCVVISLLRQV